MMTEKGTLLIVDIDEKSARVSKDVLSHLCENDVAIADTMSKANYILETNNVVFTVVNFLYNNDESLDFIKKIRANTENENHKMPILAFIEQNTDLTEQSVLNAGASICLSKPFSTADLKEKILFIINNPRNFIITDGYIGPDRRIRDVKIKTEKRKNR